jgi:hypothetical protein
MQNVIMKALELAGFKNASDISNVISATPNPVVACEMILGIYKPVVLNDENRYYFSKYRSTKTLYWLDSVDELNDQATLFTYEQDTETVYYPTKEDYHDKTNGTTTRPDEYYSTGLQDIPGIKKSSKQIKWSTINEDYKVVDPVEWHEAYDKFIVNDAEPVANLL